MWRAKAREEEYVRRMRERGYDSSYTNRGTQDHISHTLCKAMLCLCNFLEINLIVITTGNILVGKAVVLC